MPKRKFKKDEKNSRKGSGEPWFGLKRRVFSLRQKNGRLLAYWGAKTGRKHDNKVQALGRAKGRADTGTQK